MSGEPAEGRSAAATAQRLVETLGGRYSAQLGIAVDQGPDEVERWFLAATLFGHRISAEVAMRTYRTIERAGIRTIAEAAGHAPGRAGRGPTRDPAGRPRPARRAPRARRDPSRLPRAGPGRGARPPSEPACRRADGRLPRRRAARAGRAGPWSGPNRAADRGWPRSRPDRRSLRPRRRSGRGDARSRSPPAPAAGWRC